MLIFLTSTEVIFYVIVLDQTFLILVWKNQKKISRLLSSRPNSYIWIIWNDLSFNVRSTSAWSTPPRKTCSIFLSSSKRLNNAFRYSVSSRSKLSIRNRWHFVASPIIVMRIYATHTNSPVDTSFISTKGFPFPGETWIVIP